MSYLDVLLGGIKTIQNNGAPLAAEPTLNIIGATSIVDDAANKRTSVTLGTGITQLSGDVTAGPGSGSVSSTVVKANGASVPAAGALTTGNVLQVSGASALSYGPVNLAGGSNYISGTLPAGNQAAQTLGGELSGTTAAAVVAGPFSVGSWVWSSGVSPALSQTAGGATSIGHSFTISPQAGGATSGQPGSLVVSVAAPNGGSSEAGLTFSRAGSTLATVQAVPGLTTFGGLFLGGSAASATSTNAGVAGTSNSTYINVDSGGTCYVTTALTNYILNMTATTVRFGSVSSPFPLVIDWTTSTTPTIQTGTSATSLSVGTNKSAASLILQADAATTLQTLTASGTEFAKALTIDSQTAPSAPASGKMTLYVDTADGKLKVIGPSGTITTLAVP